MNYAPAQQINTVRHIARTAQQMIKDKTGMRVCLLMEPADDAFKSPWKMLSVIATALEMGPACYSIKSRARDIVELRFIGALLLRRHFHSITLHQIAAFFGGQDHSSIISGIARANDLIYTGDERFIKKYYTAFKICKYMAKKRGVKIKINSQRVTALLEIGDEMLEDFKPGNEHQYLLREYLHDFRDGLRDMLKKSQEEYLLALTGTEATAFYQLWNMLDIRHDKYATLIVENLLKKMGALAEG